MRRPGSRFKQFAAAALLLPLSVCGAEPLSLAIDHGKRTRIESGDAPRPSSECRWLGCAGPAPAFGFDFGTPRGFGAAFVEFRSPSVPGQNARPRYGIGMRAPALESALETIGLEARRCLAPVVRMRTRLTSESNLTGTVWLHLRCELN
jgi:hypothetical protein